ncbi:asparagine synthase (glutamine-hydrolyzing) [Nocardiopsis mwathae]|uniref:asparagine synthase (glutamine-hydrolyzing) n=1 Tax=Nocardiopsis mwathae TaxID=1472723 RepID=A0A7W9YF87_9ACTN|nr:asparagine synthase-related protein [Nocardiopsis mwathae]MBB6171007.1 asparagine synthase (glutamine-hydrolyzing) [Nocardiopsis mwathae]
MCAIAGLAGPDASLHAETVTAMGWAQRHRGPDGTGQACAADGRAVLAMSILKVVAPDAAVGPYRDAASGLMLALNGEVYNFRCLARRWGIELEQHETDAHLLLRAWNKHGPHALEEADGMFALAVYDPRRGVLYLARDRFGEKPLYWRLDGGRLAFASEVSSLTGYGPAALVYRPEMGALETPVAADTPYQGIQLLPPGGVLCFDTASGSLSQGRWWDLASTCPAEPAYPAAVERAVGLLESDVAARRHGGRAALLLSGGLDSALLAYLLRPQVCVTVRYPGEQRLDESATAARVARAVGAELLVVEPSAHDLCQELPRIVAALDYPVGNASLLSEHMAYRAIADRGIRVVYGGLGPDELLMGYVRHALVLFGARAVLAGGLHAYRPLASKLMGPATRPLTGPETAARLITRGPDPHGRVRALVADCFDRAGGDAARALTLVDLATSWRPLVATSDKLASAFSLERRSPYLARAFAEWCYALPADHKILRPATGKRVLRDAARELGVPEEVWANGDKLGFASPVPAWLNGPLASWAEQQVHSAIPDAPAALHPLLQAGLKPADRYDRTRMQAVIYAQWLTSARATAA